MDVFRAFGMMPVLNRVEPRTEKRQAMIRERDELRYLEEMNEVELERIRGLTLTLHKTVASFKRQDKDNIHFDTRKRYTNFNRNYTSSATLTKNLENDYSS